MIKVLIADDHTLVRQGLKRIIEQEDDMTVVAEAGDGRQAMAAMQATDCDVVVLDISMPGRNGLEILKEIKSRWKDIPALVLSMHPMDQYAVRALRAGASGYMTKDSAPVELIAAIRVLSNGKKYISADIADVLSMELDSHSGKPRHENLSDREYEVLHMIAEGKTVTTIAGELCLSVKTISTYRTRILEKMGFKTNAELTHYALKNNLVD